MNSIINGKEALVSVVIPTYHREQVLIETITYLLMLETKPAEIIIIDQTPEHKPNTTQALTQLEVTGQIRWLHLQKPSITNAMNVGLQAATRRIVLFLDDDIIPGKDLIAAHTKAQSQLGYKIVAGQVLQPGEQPLLPGQEDGKFRFNSSQAQCIKEIMGGNFSINRELALQLGGFDENFVHAAYRFEAEFADRALQAGDKIYFEPAASIHHLKAVAGGTRSYGHHLTTIKPSHTVGEYYYVLRAKGVTNRLLKLLTRPLRAIRTKHHFMHPWWIFPTLIAEALGLIWAVYLTLRGPRLIRNIAGLKKKHDGI